MTPGDDLPGFVPEARAARARRIPIWRWVLWQLALAMGMLVFYVGLTPIWIGMRGVAWVASLGSGRRRHVGGTAGLPPEPPSQS